MKLLPHQALVREEDDSFSEHVVTTACRNIISWLLSPVLRLLDVIDWREQKGVLFSFQFN